MRRSNYISRSMSGPINNNTALELTTPLGKIGGVALFAAGLIGIYILTEKERKQGKRLARAAYLRGKRAIRKRKKK